MNTNDQNPSLDEAASRFLANLSREESETSQQEVQRFIRWYGRERPLAGLTAAEVANYAERLSSADADYIKKVESIRAFLTYARKQGWGDRNLAIHLKVSKGKLKVLTSAKKILPATTSLTPQGYAKLTTKLTELKGKRLKTIDEMSKAAADKDFRENAPLKAAKEQLGYIEGRIIELEETLKSAVLLNEKQAFTHQVGIGDSITLNDLMSGEDLHYTIVSPKEVDPIRYKISNVSPIGKAIIGRKLGEVIEVTAPAGKLRYLLQQIERRDIS
ncbi:GreA/GreB family elongation factor [Chloroflexota bacterium]